MGNPLDRNMRTGQPTPSFHSTPSEPVDKKELDELNEKIKHLQALDTITDLTIESLFTSPELLDVVEAGQRYMVLGKEMIDEAAEKGLEEEASGGPRLIGIGYDLINRVSQLIENQQQRHKQVEEGARTLKRAPSLLRMTTRAPTALPPSLSALQLLQDICNNVTKLPAEVDKNLKDKISNGAKDLQDKLDNNETLSPIDLDRLSLMFLLCEQYQAKGKDTPWADEMVEHLANMIRETMPPLPPA